MATFFLPSCKINKAFPAEDARLAEYLSERWNIPALGCCRQARQKFSQEDTAVVVCHTCASIMEESSAAGNVVYAWEYLDRDENFVFPDYQGEAITVQDCFMARERERVQQAVRSLLRKMNFTVVELPAKGEKADFCGLRTLAPLKANQELAPKHFCQPGTFTPLQEDERVKFLKEYTANYRTARAVTYCGACRGAMLLGGAKAVHLLELLFPDAK